MDLVAREEFDRRRFVWGRRGSHALAVATVALGFAAMPWRAGLVVSGMMVALVLVASLAVRGADAPPASPEQASDRLRERALARLRLAWVVRIAVVLIAFTNFAMGARSVTTDAVGVVFVWSATYWMERRIRRGLARL